MGVHGLATYLREHQRILSKTLVLPRESGDPVSIVVDAWSFIYGLHHNSNLPWVYGGECDQFYQLVTTVVRAWIGVGLKVYFVFDGACPRLKFPTQVSRRGQSHVQPSLLFFRTSIPSRSTFRFLNETRILPPLLSKTCLQALNDIKETTEALQIEFADEEGDPFAVELAARIGGYVVGNDSDFVVLNTDGYLGYIPLEEMIWQTPLPVEEQAPQNDEFSDFQEVRRPKAKKKPLIAPGLGRGIIPPEGEDFTLSLTAYSPALLAAHLKIPIPLLPLLGALVGNDYTVSAQSTTSRKNVQQLFFERHLSLSQRIDRVALTLQTILSPASHGKRKPRHQVGSVMDLIDRAVHSLLSRLIGVLGSGEIDNVVDKIVEAALQYAIPKEDAPGLWPSSFCALHEPEICPLLPLLSRRVEIEVSATVDEESKALQDAIAIRARYLEAYRRGNLPPKVMDILSSGTFWPRMFLENPDLETVSRSIGRPIREWDYAILNDAVGLPDTGGSDEIEHDSEAGEEEEAEEEDEDELIDVVESDSSDADDPLAPLRGELDKLHGTDVTRAYEVTVASSVTSSRAPRRSSRPPVVTEYLRRGTRVAQETVTVQSLQDLLSSVSLADDEAEEPTPLILRTLEDRVTVFLRALQSDNPAVRALPPEHVLPVIASRWVVRTTHARFEETNSKEREKERWTKREARCFLSAFDWTSSRTPPSTQEHQAPPTVVDRHVQLTAQALSTLEDVDYLSQVLLLAPAFPSPAHLFSGKAFHDYLAGTRAPPDHTDLDAMLEAVSHGLEAAFVEDRRDKKARKATAKAVKSAPIPLAQTKANGRVQQQQKGGGGLFHMLVDADA